MSLSILGVAPAGGAVFEDRLPGVEGRHSEPIGMVIARDRLGDAEAVEAHGADVIGADLDELLHAQ